MYQIVQVGCQTVTVTTRRGALQLGYRLAMSGYLGAITRVTRDGEMIAQWQRIAGRRPQRLT